VKFLLLILHFVLFLPFKKGVLNEKRCKKGFSKKEYASPSGKIFICQGYEPFALNDLIINEKIDESDIIVGTKNVPEIWYDGVDNEKHRHYVDIYIPSQNKCIEVKSTWTMKLQEKNIMLKKIAAEKLGYNYEIWLYNQKGTRIETITS